MRNRSRNEQPSTGALAMAVIAEHPRQTLAFVMSAGAVSAIFINALFLQPMPHPAPLFVTRAAPAVSSVQTPAPAPAPASAPAAQVRTVGPDATVFAPRPRPAEAPAAVTPAAPARRDPIAELIAPKAEPKAEAKRVASAPIPPAPIPAAAPQSQATPAMQRIAAVQRALTEFGYGQVKPTGTIGPETQAAVERFERERGLPPSGQLSERVVRELSTVTSRKFD